MVLLQAMDYLTLSRPSLSRMDLGISYQNKNPLMIQFFEWNSRGSDEKTWWQFFEQEIPRLVKIGFTQAWLPPPNKAMVKEGRGYDAYDLWDLGEFDQKDGKATRWGTKDQFISACSTAKAHGLGTIIDAVLNHKLGADKTEIFPAVRVNPQNRNIEIGPVEEIEGWTGFEFPGRGSQYSKFKWNQQHFTGVDHDNRTKSVGIFKIVGTGHKGWSKRVDKELGNYDYLLGMFPSNSNLILFNLLTPPKGVDIDHRHPDVRKDLISWGHWVSEMSGSNGFRLDAIKHMDYKFLLEFIRSLNSRKRERNMNLFVVSECWSSKTIRKYMRALRGETSFFDVPLHNNFHRASRLGSDFDLRKIFSGTLVKNRPGDAVTFVDNHEQVAIFHSDCVFYGDLYSGQLYDPDVGSVLLDLIRLRQTFAYGKQIDYIKSSPLSNCIGFVRMGLNNSPQACVVLLSNAKSVQPDCTTHGSDLNYHTLSICLGRNLKIAEPEQRNAHKRYHNVLENVSNPTDVVTNASGVGKFRCSFGKLAVWVEAKSGVIDDEKVI
ncbi:hypothetical protein Clacol_002864 [Clathrus columnatus]|uniref:Glycosyl hydrolase family 13 catalytic domain-containing protein n=1 Tax=Clathrus columnatus TaxID=1419009 RepID=A0AAV5A6Q7_9AGAM|nr:hypothetical protein Clacol_002864 [Clathrus columnatus]